MGFVCRWAEREIRYEEAEEVSRQENMWENPPPSLSCIHSAHSGGLTKCISRYDVTTVEREGEGEMENGARGVSCY